MKKTLSEHYPFPEFRPGIKEAMDLIDSKPDARYVLISGKTGCGKSALAVAISRQLNAHIVTATKLLQNQYADTGVFDDEFVLKGKANYNCSHTKDTMVLAPCSSRQTFSVFKRSPLPVLLEGVDINALKTTKELRQCCVERGVCEYYQKKWTLETSRGGVLNYDLVLASDFKHPAIVFDEAHNFVDKIIDHYSFSYQMDYLCNLLGTGLDEPTQHTFKLWLEEIVTVAAQKLSHASSASKANALSSLRDKARSILDDGAMPTDYFVRAENGQVEIKTLQPKKLMHRLMGRFKRIFFLSATIDQRFADVLGLDPAHTLHVDIPSTFKVASRPIVYPKALPNINYKTVLDKKHPAVDLLSTIISHHKDHRGIIHTANYRIMDELKQLFRGENRFTWVDRGMDKADALALHAESANSILVSPSMAEGVDLADDLARFQVVMKIPFPPRNDYLESLEQAIPGWYSLCTRNILVQAYGRPVRSSKDWATTYVLDGSLSLVLTEGIDPYFASAIKRGPVDRLKLLLQSPAKPLVVSSENEGKELDREAS